MPLDKDTLYSHIAELANLYNQGELTWNGDTQTVESYKGTSVPLSQAPLYPVDDLLADGNPLIGADRINELRDICD